MSQYSENFKDKEKFIDCMNRGCEVQFIYKNKSYGIFPIAGKFIIGEDYNDKSEKSYKTAEEILHYPIEGKTLGVILNLMKITFKSL